MSLRQGIIFIGFMLTSFASLAADLSDLRIWASPDSTRIVIDVSQAVKYNYTYSAEPEKLVIDLKAENFPSNITKKDLAHTRLKKIHVSKPKPDIIRLSFDLDEKLKPKIFALKPNASYGHRLVIDLESNEREAILALFDPTFGQTSSEETQAEASPAEVKVDKVKGVRHGEKTTASSKHEVPVEVVLETPKHLENLNKDEEQNAEVVHKSSSRHKHKHKHKHRTRPFIIAIDAGHGGEDPGAIGKKGTQEKQVVLQIAKKLMHHINHNPRMRSFLIRNGDYYIGLKKRTEIARKQHADLFISIHADAFTDEKAHGASVFILSKRGASSAAARFLAEKENQSDLIGGVSLEDKGSLLASVLLDLTQTNSLEVSKEIGQNVLFSLKHVTHLHRGIIEQAGFAVLKSPDIPSILVETGFISNREGEMNLKHHDYQDKLAHAIYKGVNRYFETKPLPVVNK